MLSANSKLRLVTTRWGTLENDVFCGAGRGQRLGEAKLAQGLSSLSLPGLLRYLDQPTLSIHVAPPLGRSCIVHCTHLIISTPNTSLFYISLFFGYWNDNLVGQLTNINLMFSWRLFLKDRHHVGSGGHQEGEESDKDQKGKRNMSIV